MRGRAPLMITALALAAGGCRHAALPDPVPDPRIVGQSISFPPRAPQLEALAVEPAAAPATDAAHLFGRLVWDEDATVRVFTPFAGRVRRVLVDVGQRVSRGAALAEVESPDFAEAQAEARTAASDLVLAEQNLARLRELYDHGAAARKDLEAAEAERARAESQRARAAARLGSYGARADSITGLFVLPSPIAGTIVERAISPGQEIRPDQMLANAPALCSPLFVLSDPSRLWIQLDASEADLERLSAGCALRFTTGALPGRRFEALIDVVSESIDPGTHTVRARGTVGNPDHALKAEMLVSAEAPARHGSGASVPEGAVFLKGDRHYVFVEERPGTFVRREVEIGAERDHEIEVPSGLRVGDRVVTEGCVLLEQLLD